MFCMIGYRTNTLASLARNLNSKIKRNDNPHARTSTTHNQYTYSHILPTRCQQTYKNCIYDYTKLSQYGCDLSSNHFYYTSAHSSHSRTHTSPSLGYCETCPTILGTPGSIYTTHSWLAGHGHARVAPGQGRYIHRQGDAGDKQARKELVLTPQGIVAASPPTVQPYMRLMRIDRPIGNWLLFLPCSWSISLSAAPGCLPDPQLLTLFALGSFFMRGAGCTINDMLDKDLDRKVERTKDRPLACGQITNFQALSFLGLQLSVSLAILLSFNWNTILLGAASLIPCIIYPLMKRVTYWPQAFLGLTLNWGVLISWSAIHGQLELPGFILYISCMFWSMIYDTIYSHQDKKDDLQAGVKSTALKFGEDSKKWLTLFSSVMIAGLTSTGIMCDQTLPYFAGVAMVSAHLGHQIYTVDLNNGEDCGKKFRSNKNLGIAFWLMIMGANLLKTERSEEKNATDD